MLFNLNLLTASRRAGLAIVALALAAGFAGCKDKTDAAPETGVDYYPVAVGNYWTYAVADTSWSEASGTGTQVVYSIPTPSAYQFKETVTEIFTDAAGQPAYRLVRSKLVPPATTFRPDSVFVLTATPQVVALNRNNAKTLELIFPVKEGRSWNLNAYNNSSNDTIIAETRQYSKHGQAFTTAATGSFSAKTYPNTITTNNTGTATESSLTREVSYRQVFAKGVGPVFRRRSNFKFYNYPLGLNQQVYPPGAYSSGFTRRETLIDYKVN